MAHLGHAKFVKISRGSLYFKIKWKLWLIVMREWGYSFGYREEISGKCLYPIISHSVVSSSSFCAPFFFWSGEVTYNRFPPSFPDSWPPKLGGGDIWAYLRREWFCGGLLKTYIFRVKGFSLIWWKNPTQFYGWFI